MNAMVRQTSEMLELLSDEDVLLIHDLVKKLLRAWDPDFTKVTLAEKMELDKADEEMKKGEYFTEADVWA